MVIAISARRVWSIREPGGFPADAVYIGRPGPWGNPFALDPCESREATIARYVDYLWAPEQRLLRVRARRALRGRSVLCWCWPRACHGVPLLLCADGEEADGPPKAVDLSPLLW